MLWTNFTKHSENLPSISVYDFLPIKVILKVLLSLTPSSICCPNFIPYFWLLVMSLNLGMKSENWGSVMKIDGLVKFKTFCLKMFAHIFSFSLAGPPFISMWELLPLHWLLPHFFPLVCFLDYSGFKITSLLERVFAKLGLLFLALALNFFIFFFSPFIIGQTSSITWLLLALVELSSQIIIDFKC